MIPMHKVFMPKDIDEVMNPLRQVIESGWIGEGPQVADFEKEVGAFIGTDHVTALNSRSAALQLALRLSGVGAGDEVITTAMSCVASNTPIILSGATPVWADVQPGTGNIDPVSIRKRISERTKAIVVAHWGGYPCDLDEINTLAGENHLKVIEDCAHAWGAEYQGKMVGAHSDFSCFSLQAIQHFTTGDGSILVSCREQDHHRARSLEGLGTDREQRVENSLGISEWDIVDAGHGFQMNDIAAAIGLAQLPYLRESIGLRRANAAYFRNAFRGLEQVRLLDETEDRRSSYGLFTIKVQKPEAFIGHMRTQGVAASIVHSRNDRYAIFAQYCNADLYGLDAFSGQMVCIPVGHWIGEAEREKIAQVVRSQEWVAPSSHVVVVSEDLEEKSRQHTP